jgi:hypothetical protein
MSLRQFRTSQLLLILTAFTACYGQSASEEMLFENAIDDLTGVLAAEAVAFDAEVTNDGTGSLRIVTDGATTVRLYEVGDIDVEDARLVYRAQLRTDSMEGQVYLEMWCRFPGMGEYFSRALDTPLSGTTEWTQQETPFFLEAGQNPDHVALNVVIASRRHRSSWKPDRIPITLRSTS